MWYILSFLFQKHGSLVSFIKIFNDIYRKFKSLNIVIYSLLQAKIGDFPTKKGVIKMVLLYLAQQSIIAYFACLFAGTAGFFDILNLDNIDEGPAIVTT